MKIIEIQRAEMRARYIIAAAALLALVVGHALGAEPTAAGLWQAVDQETGQPTGWFLIRDHDGICDGIRPAQALPAVDPFSELKMIINIRWSQVVSRTREESR